MFREMRRFKQQISREACIGLLKREPRGVLSVLGDDEYPYGLPIDHWYCEEDGKLYFHGASTGHKIDALKRHDKASFCVYDQGWRREGEWALNIQSVVVFGRIKPVEEPEKALEICRQIALKFTSDAGYIEDELRRAGPRALCLELTAEHMTGKLVNES